MLKTGCSCSISCREKGVNINEKVLFVKKITTLAHFVLYH